MSASRERLSVLLVSTYELGRQPFGLASPAAWLRQEGARVACADLAVGELPAEKLRTADLVAFFLPMHTATRLAAPLLRRFRQYNPRAHLCCYGLYAPPNAAYLRQLGAQTILGGEFEAALVRLYRCLRRGESPPGEPPVSLERQLFRVPEREGLPGLEHYARLRRGEREVLVGYTEASRGCLHLCRHCPVVPVYGGRFRVVQRQVVLEDIRRQVRAGAGHITFGDPDFFNGPGHALGLVRALHAEFPLLSYDATIKVEHLLEHARHLPLLRETGCAFVTTAVESVDDGVLTLLDKGHTRADFVRAVALCRGAGLALNPTFVPFTPWTRAESYLDLLHLLVELGLVEQVAPVQLSIRLLVPAGSRLLELEQMRAHLGPFSAERLSYGWVHADGRMDGLQEEVAGLVQAGEGRGEGRRAIFARIWERAHGVLGRGVPPLHYGRDPATIPFLTEPWYC